jgi:hypothetical protein
VKLRQWREFPRHVREHLSQRLKDRGIRADDLDKLRVWVESEPDVPAGDWYRDFGSFKICGTGADPTTFLTREQQAWGEEAGGE